MKGVCAGRAGVKLARAIGGRFLRAGIAGKTLSTGRFLSASSRTDAS